MTEYFKRERYIKNSAEKSASPNKARQYSGKTIGRIGFCTSWAVCRHGSDKQWLEVVETDLHIDKLPEQFYGKKIVHISDLHYSRTVSSKYLKACIKTINNLDPDFVVMTGDYITHDISGRYRERVVKLISHIKSKNGIYACLGNHDYGVDGFVNSDGENKMFAMIENMEHNGIVVLRNQAQAVEIDGKPLWLVGLGDIWAHDFAPDKAFEKIKGGEAVIALSHNPASVEHLKYHKFDAALCGHTHGLRHQLTKSLRWPILKTNHYHSGMYYIGDRKIYVNRGLGRLGRPSFFNTPRPEVTVYNLC